MRAVAFVMFVVVVVFVGDVVNVEVAVVVRTVDTNLDRVAVTHKVEPVKVDGVLTMRPINTHPERKAFSKPP